MRNRGRLWIWTAAVAAAVGVVLWIVVPGDDEERVTESERPTSGVGAVEPRPRGGSSDEDGSGVEGERPSEEEGRSEAELRPRAEQVAVRRAVRAYRSYVAAIAERDGGAICARIEPGFLAQLRPPVREGSCAERIGDSIGFADERGFPVWEETVLSGIDSSRLLDGGRVRLTATIVTRFADRDQPSVESDVAYLVPDGERSYRLAQPTGALWRAVGKPDVPPQAITPPPGF